MTLSNKNKKDGRGRPEKLSRNQLTEAIKSIAEKHIAKDTEDEKVIATVNRVTAELEIEYDIEVSSQTVREKGVSPTGYYKIKYDSIDYINYGNKQFRGMLIKPKEFLNELKENQKEKEINKKQEAIEL